MLTKKQVPGRLLRREAEVSGAAVRQEQDEEKHAEACRQMQERERIRHKREWERGSKPPGLEREALATKGYMITNHLRARGLGRKR